MVARGVKRLKTDTHPFVKIPPSWDYPFFLDFPTRCANEPFSISCNGFPFSDHHFGPNLSIGPKTEGVFMGRGLKKGSNSRTHTHTHYHRYHISSGRTSTQDWLLLLSEDDPIQHTATLFNQSLWQEGKHTHKCTWTAPHLCAHSPGVLGHAITNIYLSKETQL